MMSQFRTLTTLLVLALLSVDLVAVLDRNATGLLRALAGSQTVLLVAWLMLARGPVVPRAILAISAIVALATVAHRSPSGFHHEPTLQFGMLAVVLWLLRIGFQQRLTIVASVAAPPASDLLAPKPAHRQFSIQSVLLAITAIAIWLAMVRTANAKDIVRLLPEIAISTLVCLALVKFLLWPGFNLWHGAMVVLLLVLAALQLSHAWLLFHLAAEPRWLPQMVLLVLMLCVLRIAGLRLTGAAAGPTYAVQPSAAAFSKSGTADAAGSG